MREKINSRLIRGDNSPYVQNASGTYIAPDIEIIDIELGHSILDGSTPELPGEEL